MLISDGNFVFVVLGEFVGIVGDESDDFFKFLNNLKNTVFLVGRVVYKIEIRVKENVIEKGVIINVN